jgi:hypothetical protein
VRHYKAPTRLQNREGSSQGMSKDVLSFCFELESNLMVVRLSTVVNATKDMVEGH